MCPSGSPRAETAGFVLAGGKSSRMGRDKALLPWEGASLVEHVARAVEQAARSVALVGPAGSYPNLPYPLIPDLYPGFGPVGGIVTALSASSLEWNLVLACDLPGVDAPLLKRICAAAWESGAACTVPVTSDGRQHPLCAVYRKSSALAVLREAVERDEHRLIETVAHLRPQLVHLTELEALWNVNTSADWDAFQASRSSLPAS